MASDDIKFKSDEENAIVYSIPKNAAELSATFKYHIKKAELEIVFPRVSHKHNGYDCVINTSTMLSFIEAYLSYWSKNQELEDYIKEEPVCVGDPSVIITDKNDLLLIKKFLADKKELDDKTIILSTLTCQAEYLGLNGLINKLYAYFAVLIFNTSVIDFQQATHNPEFEAIKEKVLLEWKKEHTEE